MGRRIDLKSLLIGGLLVAVVVCAMGGAPVLGPESIGRFMMVTHDKDYGGVYVIDTATGRVWQQANQADVPNAFYPASLEQDVFHWPNVDPNLVDPNAPQP